jgi:RNA polymerase sigma-70 factor (ECF subfamily)
MSEFVIPQQSSADPDDFDLVHRAQAGDISAFEELIRRHYGRIYQLIYSMTCCRDTAEERTKEAFINVWKDIGWFRSQHGLEIWFYRTALDCVVKTHKRRIPKSTAVFDEFDPGIKTAESYRGFSSKGAVLRKISLKEFQETINGALLGMSDNERATVAMQDIQGLPPERIAEIMRCPEETVQVRRKSAFQQLRKAFDGLSEGGIEDSDIAGLLALKRYEKPEESRSEKNIQAIIREVRVTDNTPLLLSFPEKGFSWVFTKTRYGVAALFLLFLGLHLLKKPVPSAPGAPVAIMKAPVPGSSAVSTNGVKDNPALGITPRSRPITVNERNSLSEASK